MKFKDKVIWITGAASGIGEALAYQAVRYGAKLVLSDIDEEGLKMRKHGCRTYCATPRSLLERIY